MATPMMADSPRPVTGGVDTHKDEHVAAVLDGVGVVLGTASFPNRASGHIELGRWLASFGPLGRVGVEGTGSYGAGLARYLRGIGVEVVEVNRPDRSARRLEGKSDPLDAIAAARAVLSGRHSGTPKSADGIVESIRMLRLSRRSAIQSRTQCVNQIHSLVDTAPAPLREQWATMRVDLLVSSGAAMVADGPLEDPAVCAVWTLRGLAQRWQWLNAQITAIDEHLAVLVPAAAPSLVALFGVGIDTAGALIVAAGDNPDRLRNEAGFAALCGVNPLPASSGRTNRHRVNRGGNRTANQALWRIALVRMAHDPETRAYVERRTKEGLSKREIIRCLKRYIARQVFPHLQAITTAAPATTP